MEIPAPPQLLLIGGVVGMVKTAKSAGLDKLIGFDMGGTSTDVALIRNYQPSVSNEIEIEYAMPIHVPMVDVRTIGAGGGSIAWINEGGLLSLGPASAGAHPGPACYQQGGSKPTVTDAHAMLGHGSSCEWASPLTLPPSTKRR